jgi:hypothetical protein
LIDKVLEGALKDKDISSSKQPVGHVDITPRQPVGHVDITPRQPVSHVDITSSEEMIVPIPA